MVYFFVNLYRRTKSRPDCDFSSPHSEDPWFENGYTVYIVTRHPVRISKFRDTFPLSTLKNAQYGQYVDSNKPFNQFFLV